MSIWTTITEWYSKPTSPQTVVWIADNNVRPPYVDTPIKADETYLRISLVEMVLGKSRAWFKDYQPTVQSLAKLKFGDQVVELPSIAAADPSRYAAGGSVLANFRLLDLVPFRGGSVALEAALIALPGDDKLANGIRALSNVAGLIAAPISAVLAVAGKVKESADMLVGSGAQVHLAYHNTLVAQPGASQLRCGYLVVARVDPAELGNPTLVVDNEQLKVWEGTTGRPLGHDYMLLHIEGLPNRDDLRAFSDLDKLRSRMLEAFIKQDDPAGDTAYREALTAIVMHPELINADRRVLADELKADRDRYRTPAMGMAPPAVPRSWDELTSKLPAGKDHAKVSLAEYV